MVIHRGVIITHEVSSICIFRGQQVTIYIYDAELGCCGKRVESLFISISPLGEMLVEKSSALKVRDYEYADGQQHAAEEYHATIHS